MFDSRIGGAADRHGRVSGTANLHALLCGEATGVDLRGESKQQRIPEKRLRLEKRKD